MPHDARPTSLLPAKTRSWDKRTEGGGTAPSNRTRCRHEACPGLPGTTAV